MRSSPPSSIDGDSASDDAAAGADVDDELMDERHGHRLVRGASVAGVMEAVFPVGMVAAFGRTIRSMRSGEQVLFEATVRRGAALLVVAAYNERLRVLNANVAQLGVPATEVAARLAEFGRLARRASRRRHLRPV
jgi:hypothetical protein